MGNNSPQKKSPLFIKAFNGLVKRNLTNYFDFDNLLKTSMSRSVSTNLGKEFWDEPMRVLLDSVKNEAELTSWGAYIFREKLIGQLVNRLRAEDWFNKRPEILENELLPIYLITGLQRTGTTKLQRLLSDQIGARALFSWEAMNPSPIVDFKETKKRIRQTNINAKAVKWMAREFNSIHPIIADQPEEDILLLDITFMSTTFEAILNVPTYSEWLEKNDNGYAYEYEVKLLKLLQAQRNGKYWILKSPHHLEHLPLVKKYLDPKKIIYTHRDLMKVIPSFMSMLFYSRTLFSDKVSLENIKTHWLPKMKRMTELGMAYANENNSNILHLKFEDWMETETETIASILNITRSEINTKKSNYKSSHHYDAKSLGIDKEVVNELFKDYNKKINK